MRKSVISVEGTMQLPTLDRSYYLFCLENALFAIKQARALVKDNIIETDHELPRIEKLISEAYNAS